MNAFINDLISLDRNSPGNLIIQKNMKNINKFTKKYKTEIK